MKIAKLKMLPGILFAVVALLAISVAPVMAQPVTSPFSGAVTIDGVAAPDGSEVAAYVADETEARTTTTTSGGAYALGLIGDASDVGKPVSFKVKKAGTGVWLDATTAPPNPTFANYDPQVVDLSATSPLPTVGFSSATYSVGEGAGSTTITVDLSAASAETVTVDYTTSDGTATAGSDYTAASGTLTFDPDDTSKTFSVTILEDALVEASETVNLSLSNPTNATLGTPGTAVLTIVDNDPPSELLEYGDALDPTYPSLLASDGARHNPTESEFLGLLSAGEGKDFELDANVPDSDLLDDGLVTMAITAGDPLETVTFEVTDFMAPSSDLRVNILIDLNGNGDWADAGEHVVQNQQIITSTTAGEVFVSTAFSTVGATPGSTWLRITLTRHEIQDPPWDGTMADAGLGDEFEFGETEDWPITIEEEEVAPGVGGTAYPINKLAVLAPWIALAAAIIAGATIFMRRRRAQS